MKSFTKALVLAVLVFFLVLAALELRPFGMPQKSAMDDYIIVKGQEETAANNLVSAVVFDYRGFDTLGEATVLFAAVSGAYLLFRRELK